MVNTIVKYINNNCNELHQGELMDTRDIKKRKNTKEFAKQMSHWHTSIKKVINVEKNKANTKLGC